MGAYTPRATAATTVGAGRDGWELHLLSESAELVGPEGRWRPPRGACLVLAFLALEGATPRDRLAGLMWPDRPEPRARANLRQTLLRICRQAPVLDREAVALRHDVWVDVRDMGVDELARVAPVLAAVRTT